MKPNTQGGLPSWASEQVEAYLDDLLTQEERQAFEEELKQCFELREEVEAAKHFHGLLHSLPMRHCPERVTEQVLAGVQKQSTCSRRWSWPTLSEWLNPHSSWVVFATACVVVLILVFQFRQNGDPGPSHPTPREVRIAERQIGATMTYLAHIGARTGTAVQAEVYHSAVVVPIQETVRAIVKTDLAASIKSIVNKEI